MQDLINTIGLQPEHFNLMIIGVIIIGGVWAVIRLYRDLTGPDREIYQELEAQQQAYQKAKGE